MPTLSDTKLRQLKPKDKAYTLSDGEGLSLLIKINGTKLWEFRYTSPTKLKRRKATLGTYPNSTLSNAREKAQEYKRLITEGIDPIDKNKEVRHEKQLETSRDFSKVVAEWFKLQENQLASSTYSRKVNQFTLYVEPFFENRPINTITHPEIVKVIELKAKTAPESASRLLGYLNDLWQFATTKGYCDFNVIVNIHKKTVLPKIKKTSYSKIVDRDNLRELIQSINLYKGSTSVRNVLKFVMHIPLRAENLINLKWEYVDLDKQLLTIPRPLMKVKNENLPNFTMPLTEQVVDILKEQKLFATGTFVFRADGYADVPIGKETPNRALQRMGFNNEIIGKKIRLHGFRGTFRSLADTHQMTHNVSKEAKERALDHLPKSAVEMAYTHKADYIEELKVLMTWWSNYLEGL